MSSECELNAPAEFGGTVTLVLQSHKSRGGLEDLLTKGSQGGASTVSNQTHWGKRGRISTGKATVV